MRCPKGKAHLISAFPFLYLFVFFRILKQNRLLSPLQEGILGEQSVRGFLFLGSHLYVDVVLLCYVIRGCC